jgi:hypothetical protein
MGLLTAYLADTPKRRKAYDKVALGRFAGGVMFFFAGCLLLLMAGIVEAINYRYRQA